MNVFQEVFLKNTKPFNFSFTDYFFNYLAFIEMASYYFKHKLYNHYYNYIINNMHQQKMLNVRFSNRISLFGPQPPRSPHGPPGRRGPRS